MTTLFEAWKTYEAKVVPAGAGAVQREECRRAFYAGATAAFYLTLTATEPADIDEGADNLAQIQRELEAFPTDLRVTE